VGLLLKIADKSATDTWKWLHYSARFWQHGWKQLFCLSLQGYLSLV